MAQNAFVAFSLIPRNVRIYFLLLLIDAAFSLVWDF